MKEAQRIKGEFSTFWSWRKLRRTLLALAAIATVFAVFYAEENWRGKRAWENCRRELAAAGAVVDWLAYIPPPVPDDRNFFKAPKMTEWFVRSSWSAPGTNDFSLRLNHPDSSSVGRSKNTITNAASAEKYLEWSDRLAPDFNLIREAVKRPDARMDGDFERPFETMPLPNFILIRNLVQTLAQRTHCYLLLGRPEEALSNLTLIHELCPPLLEGRPSGKPMTLVAAMIDVAVTGLYVNTIAEGLKLHAWGEPQLAAIQTQLGQVNLFALVASALEWERAAACHTMESTSSGQLAKLLAGDSEQRARRILLRLMPRGWIYQNMTGTARLGRKYLEGFDVVESRVFPYRVDEAVRDIQKSSSRWSPFNVIAALTAPNITRAYISTAKNQALINEAMAACALERYRLAHGNYPQSLDALMPQFITRLPGDVIGGAPLKYRLVDADSSGFLLYSVGWNGKDDGGEIATDEMGDWVWMAPAR